MKKRNYLLIVIMFLVLCSFIDVHAAANCDGVLGTKLIEELDSVRRIIQILAPIVLLLLTSLDFAKVVFSDNKDGLNKAKNNFLKRAVAVLIIFFAPYIIKLVLEIVNLETAKSCLNT